MDFYYFINECFRKIENIKQYVDTMRLSSKTFRHLEENLKDINNISSRSVSINNNKWMDQDDVVGHMWGVSIMIEENIPIHNFIFVSVSGLEESFYYE